MNQQLEDFLNREERRRNRSLSKRFRVWLQSDQGKESASRIERVLAKAGNESQAVQLLKAAEESCRADDVYRKQDAKRQKSLKQFESAFEDWLVGPKGGDYRAQIRDAKDDEARELALMDAQKAFARAYPHLLPADYRDASKTRIRPVRYARTSEVEDLMFGVIEPGLSQMGMVGADILRNWEKIVGPALAQNTQPERVGFAPNQRSNGTLFIKARAGFNTIVQHNSAQIIFRINSHFGFKAVSEVRISKRFFRDDMTTGAKVAQKVISQRVEPVAELPEHMARLIANIKDPEMRKAFEELGKVIKARNG